MRETLRTLEDHLARQAQDLQSISKRSDPIKLERLAWLPTRPRLRLTGMIMLMPNLPSSITLPDSDDADECSNDTENDGTDGLSCG